MKHYLLALAIFIGASLPISDSATIVNVAVCQEKQTIDDRLTRLYESTVRVSTNSGTGTGNVFNESETHYYVLTNAHVVGRASNVGIEFTKFWKNIPYHSPVIRGKVEQRRLIEGGSFDVAIVSIPKSSMRGVKIPVIPLATRVDDDEAQKLGLLTNGCQAGELPSIQPIRVKKSDGQLIYYVPTSRPGRSGSAIVDVKSGKIYGLVAWMTGQGKNSQGLAMTAKRIRPWVLNKNAVIETTMTPEDVRQIPLAPPLPVIRKRQEPFDAIPIPLGKPIDTSFQEDVDEETFIRRWRRNNPPWSQPPSQPQQPQPDFGGGGEGPWGGGGGESPSQPFQGGGDENSPWNGGGQEPPKVDPKPSTPSEPDSPWIPQDPEDKPENDPKDDSPELKPDNTETVALLKEGFRRTLSNQKKILAELEKKPNKLFRRTEEPFSEDQEVVLGGFLERWQDRADQRELDRINRNQKNQDEFIEKIREKLGDHVADLMVASGTVEKSVAELKVAANSFDENVKEIRDIVSKVEVDGDKVGRGFFAALTRRTGELIFAIPIIGPILKTVESFLSWFAIPILLLVATYFLEMVGVPRDWIARVIGSFFRTIKSVVTAVRNGVSNLRLEPPTNQENKEDSSKDREIERLKQLLKNRN
jgi:hypothetical protein